MTRTIAFLELGFIRLDRRKKTSLVQQFYEALRNAILSGQLSRGHRLPSTRSFATDLGVSRMTVVNAFDQLTAEGYLNGSVGRGTYVSEHLPEERQLVKFRPPKYDPLTPTEELPRKLFSNRGRDFEKAYPDDSDFPVDAKPFRAGVPALDEFPIDVWSRLCRRRWKQVSESDLTYGDPAGYLPLRKAIAGYVRAFRGVRCDESQVMIVSGTQQAVDVVARIATDPGDRVLFEDPGYRRARAGFKAAGARIVPVPVDDNGMIVEQAVDKFSNARIAYVTPSHQFPMGVTLSIERRMQLVEWAEKTGGLIFEDDYDSEYRYAQRPIPALQGLDRAGRTIYVGSFSKVIFPSLSIGYAIVPPGMVDLFRKAMSLVGRPASTVDQQILADFIEQGNFARHLRRMRTIHEQRRTTLVESIEQNLGLLLRIVGSDAGLHCTALWRDNRADEPIVERAGKNGIVLKAVSRFFYTNSSPRLRNGLIFGFASATPGQIKSGIRRLTALIETTPR